MEIIKTGGLRQFDRPVPDECVTNTWRQMSPEYLKYLEVLYPTILQIHGTAGIY